MSDRNGLQFVAACSCLLLIAIATSAALGRQSVVANDPVVLQPQSAGGNKPGAVGDPVGAAPIDATASKTNSLPAATAESPIKVGPTQAPAGLTGAGGPVAPVSTTESKALGRPNNPLSARPSQTLKPSPTMLERIDPRSNEITRVLGALAVVVGLLLMIRTILRRTGSLLPRGDRPSGVVEILARYPIARGQQLILLKLARRILLLHQAGSSMTALTEMTEPDEVASLLARMEAGAGERSVAKFRTALNEFVADHHAIQDRGPRANALPRLEAEVIDLTRNRTKSFAAMLGRQRKALR